MPFYGSRFALIKIQDLDPLCSLPTLPLAKAYFWNLTERCDLGGVGREIFKILLCKTSPQLSLDCVTLWIEIRSSVCLVCVYVCTVNIGPFSVSPRIIVSMLLFIDSVYHSYLSNIFEQANKIQRATKLIEGMKTAEIWGEMKIGSVCGFVKLQLRSCGITVSASGL